MERYLRRNRVSETVDGLGVTALIYGASALWFVWLWGLGIPALLAGAALGTLGQMARMKWRARTVVRREKALRCRIGGELLLEELLLAPAREAHFRTALLLAERWPVVMQEAKEEGALCRQGEETLLVICLRTPPGGETSRGDLIAAQRAVRRCGADRGILCTLGKTPPRMLAYAEQTPVPLRIVCRETLLVLAEQFAPATDEQLVALARRRDRNAGRGSALQLIFRKDKARRYFAYGVTLLLVYVLTGVRAYAVPGMVCLTMGTLCGTGRSAPERL